MIVCENVWTPLLDAQMALSKLHLCALVWEAWTDFGSVGAGRRAILTQIDNFRQGLAHPRLDPTQPGRSCACGAVLEQIRRAKPSHHGRGRAR